MKNSVHAILLGLLVVAGIACNASHNPMKAEATSQQIQVTGDRIVIGQDGPSVALPQSCGRSKWLVCATPEEIKKGMKAQASDCQPAYDLLRKIASKEEYRLFLSGCAIESLIVVSTAAKVDDLAFRLREEIPAAMKWHHFPAEECSDKDYKFGISQVAGWSVATFPYGIDYGDGDGSVVKAQYCFRANGNRSLMLVFVGNQCRAAEAQWPKLVESILASYSSTKNE